MNPFVSTYCRHFETISISDSFNFKGTVSHISSDYKQTSTDKELAGAGDYETFTFKAESKGNAVIALTYNKPWEEGVAPLKTFKINITVE